MESPLVSLLLVGLIALASCAPPPAAPGSVAPAATATPLQAPAIRTTSAPAVTATTAPSVPTTVALLPASPAAKPTRAPAATVPTRTSTPAPETVASSAAPDHAAASRAPTFAPGFTTYRDPEAGFAIDYPAGWFITVPPAEARLDARAYTASIRSVSPQSQQPRGQALPARATGIDVTVLTTKATTFDEVVAERRNDIANSETAVEIVSEEFWIMPRGQRAVRWQLETAQAGTVASLSTLLNGKLVIIAGMGDLTQFDAIARSLRPEGRSGPAAGPTQVAVAPRGSRDHDGGALGYTAALPPDWEPGQNSGLSQLFYLKPVNEDRPAFPRFYVTVLPAGLTDAVAAADAGAYNFISEEHVKALMALPVGGSRATNDLPAYSTFTRLPDTAVSGLPAVVIENARVWEGGANTKDRRVLVRVGTSTYMFGTYYETPVQLAEFERVLGGVKISTAGVAAP